MTTVETQTQTETPDDLSAALSKTSDAHSAIVAQISDLQTSMRRRRARLDELEMITLEHSRLVAHLRDQVGEAETKLGYARTLAGVAKGTATEKSTSNNVKTLTTDLAGLQQQLQEAQLAYSTQNTQARVENSNINKELEQNQAELETLERTRSELKEIRAEKKEALGQVTYAALAYEMRGLLEAERKLEEALAEHRTERLALQESIAEKLIDWPDLLRQATQELTPEEKQAPEVAPAVKLAQRILKALDALQELKEHSMRMGHPALEPTSQIDTRMVVRRLTLDEQFIHLVLTSGPQGLNLIERKRFEIEEYLRQVEQLARDRALYHELALYNRGR